MDTNTLITFSRHIKLAYGAKEHKILADLSSGSDASPGVRNLMRAGSLGTDKGLRHPHLPWNDNRHAFASMSKAQHGARGLQQQQRAASDIAGSIVRPSRTGMNLRSRYQAAKGLLRAGEGNHLVSDIGAHLEKPIEQGFASRMRRFTPQVGYGGGYLVGAREHQKTMGGSANKYIDALTNAPVGVRSKNRAVGYGNVLRKRVASQLVAQHGHSPTSAEAAASRFFTSYQPGKLTTLAAKARNNASLVRGEVGRVGSLGRSALSRLRSLRR